MSLLRGITSAAYMLWGQHAAARARTLSRDIRSLMHEAGTTPNDVDDHHGVKSKIWRRTRHCSEKELLFLYAVDKEVAMMCERVARQHLMPDLV
ncbi:hypothetical protein [Cupriavidus numazuensis]|uniref:Type II toxin-antitoxin system RelE/ParE family toxin n=1 Tax=Cupriavidus numazuensis TaxID=221992 RepID=A0ABN7Q1X2_9BURK|nr:hypothetical protein [Cupriavidus numazuensis]CAG2153780.1 hypothetical protein LMG26411_04465 [Cupriavidus numazuensis]